MWVLKSSFSCYHMPALKPLLPGLYTRLLALKVSRFLYYTFLMSIFAKGNNSKNRKGNNRKNNRKKIFTRLSTYNPLSPIQVCSNSLL